MRCGGADCALSAGAHCSGTGCHCLAGAPAALASALALGRSRVGSSSRATAHALGLSRGLGATSRRHSSGAPDVSGHLAPFRIDGVLVAKLFCPCSPRSPDAYETPREPGSSSPRAGRRTGRRREKRPSPRISVATSSMVPGVGERLAWLSDGLHFGRRDSFELHICTTLGDGASTPSRCAPACSSGATRPLPMGTHRVPRLTGRPGASSRARPQDGRRPASRYRLRWAARLSHCLPVASRTVTPRSFALHRVAWIFEFPDLHLQPAAQGRPSRIRLEGRTALRRVRVPRDRERQDRRIVNAKIGPS